MAINVGRAPNDRRLLDGLANTIRSVFPSVYIMDIPQTFNSIIYATVQPTRAENIYDNLISLYKREGIHPLLVASLERVVKNMRPLPQTGPVFTDDRAPIEWITNNMVLDFVFSGDIQELQEGH
jgi:hypothetical protein